MTSTTWRSGRRGGSAATVNLSATSEPWRLSHPLPQRVDRIAVYDVAEATWRLTKP
ncbi:hypothetical protein ABT297_42670 [Dactylosporangium sp. NPDC000555]|uniref:hypothetical protein n=1 Tax=Dactylosporangium sp. NPDC000555 TaxID=3154260 RepID=UPI00333412CB